VIRLIPAIIAISVACYFAGNAAYQMNGAASAINSYDAVAAAVQANSADPPAECRPEPKPDPNARVIERRAEPVYKSLIHCLADIDDLLDTIHDPATFAAARPKLLARAHEQADYAKAYPGGGMARLSKSAAKELETALKRHAGSLTRAYRAMPAVKPFFENELAKVLEAK
jgi:hypothetical protein